MSVPISSSHHSGHRRRWRRSLKTDDKASVRTTRAVIGFLGLLILALLISLAIIATTVSE
ncbi:hypothetical protein HNQ93_003949 [Hymenobacter luteus]|uniref:Uncharacterized protein n=2 Tax=Hymenobacter TaxID=89966 RepID=A0A7W9WE45_9BACT|nr:MULTISPECIES: hypothetical protein [Hymenobacter]MBB4603371.1 hypothetical protein [Hymenobacter latericoloratus]MBB6061071.1 hypothetical protein [Hymenobacter luteus]